MKQISINYLDQNKDSVNLKRPPVSNSIQRYILAG